MPEVIDFTDSVEPSFELINPGRYKARVESAEMKTSGEDAKHPGQKYVAVEFVIVQEPYENRRQWLNMSTHVGCKLHNNPDPCEKAAEVVGGFKKSLRGFGYTDEQLSGTIEFDENDLIGKYVVIVVSKSKDKQSGEMRNNVRQVLPLDADDMLLPT